MNNYEKFQVHPRWAATPKYYFKMFDSRLILAPTQGLQRNRTKFFVNRLTKQLVADLLGAVGGAFKITQSTHWNKPNSQLVYFNAGDFDVTTLYELMDTPKFRHELELVEVTAPLNEEHADRMRQSSNMEYELVTRDKLYYKKYEFSATIDLLAEKRRGYWSRSSTDQKRYESNRDILRRYQQNSHIFRVEDIWPNDFVMYFNDYVAFQMMIFELDGPIKIKRLQKADVVQKIMVEEKELDAV